MTSWVGGVQGVGTSREESPVRDPRGLLVEPVVSQEFLKRKIVINKSLKVTDHDSACYQRELYVWNTAPLLE